MAQVKINFNVFLFFSFSVNSDGLSPLDVAVLSNNRSLAKMLVTFGAQEGNQCEYNFFLYNYFLSSKLYFLRLLKNKDNKF